MIFFTTYVRKQEWRFEYESVLFLKHIINHCFLQKKLKNVSSVIQRTFYKIYSFLDLKTLGSWFAPKLLKLNGFTFCVFKITYLLFSVLIKLESTMHSVLSVEERPRIRFRRNCAFNDTSKKICTEMNIYGTMKKR